MDETWVRERLARRTAATRYVETSAGILSYRELAPLLPERVADTELAISDRMFAALPLLDLLLELHRRICADSTPDMAGRWLLRDVRVGESTAASGPHAPPHLAGPHADAQLRRRSRGALGGTVRPLRRKAHRLADLPLPEGRKRAKALVNKRARAAAPYPADLPDCLEKDTTWLRSHGWNWPPGSRRVFYWRPSDAISIGAQRVRTSVRGESRVEAMLLSLTNASRNDHALPPVSRTLPQAESCLRTILNRLRTGDAIDLESSLETANRRSGRPETSPRVRLHPGFQRPAFAT